MKIIHKNRHLLQVRKHWRTIYRLTKKTMKQLLLIIFILTTTLVYSQTQWFPVKLDKETAKQIADTTNAFPVCFIKVFNGQVSMYGHGTHYPTPMKLKNNFYYSSRLIMPYGDSTIMLYISASYYFQLGKKQSKLIIKTAKQTDTLLFIKSTRPFKDINVKWG